MTFSLARLAYGQAAEDYWHQELGKHWVCTKHPWGKHGPDLHIEGHGIQAIVEVERRSTTWPGHFPWASLQILERRLTSARKQSLPVHILTCGPDVSEAVVFRLPSHELLQEQLTHPEHWKRSPVLAVPIEMCYQLPRDIVEAFTNA